MAPMLPCAVHRHRTRLSDSSQHLLHSRSHLRNGSSFFQASPADSLGRSWRILPQTDEPFLWSWDSQYKLDDQYRLEPSCKWNAAPSSLAMLSILLERWTTLELLFHNYSWLK
ncbi:centromere protein V [Platysternon megacephalum]|uniref:Centromere protein V n=1 Tax=Platysternon megacephalum TaxID=55544 RepID=A0A4D9F1T8_9SAUR|nr:centromere protein V [Platysternon megacephalum]